MAITTKKRTCSLGNCNSYDRIHKDIVVRYNPNNQKWTIFHRDDWKAYHNGCGWKYTHISDKRIDKIMLDIQWMGGLHKLKKGKD